MLGRALRIGGVWIAACAFGLAFGLSSGGATKTVTIPSRLSIEATGLKFSGRVSSSAAPCRQARRVTLYRRLSNGGRQALGSRSTGSSGKWQITVSGWAGISMAHFYATVRQRSEGTAGTIYVCKGARSKTIALQP